MTTITTTRDTRISTLKGNKNKLERTERSEIMPTTRGPIAAPIDPVPSMMAVTIALAFWLDFREAWVPWKNGE